MFVKTPKIYFILFFSIFRITNWKYKRCSYFLEGTQLGVWRNYSPFNSHYSNEILMLVLLKCILHTLSSSRKIYNTFYLSKTRFLRQPQYAFNLYCRTCKCTNNHAATTQRAIDLVASFAKGDVMGCGREIKQRTFQWVS